MRVKHIEWITDDSVVLEERSKEKKQISG